MNIAMSLALILVSGLITLGGVVVAIEGVEQKSDEIIAGGITAFVVGLIGAVVGAYFLGK